jgi:pimeloyl-ACP methyl ester carboxylesterase
MLASAAGLAALALASCGGGGAPGPSYEVPSVRLNDLHPCHAVPQPPAVRCGAVKVPFERQDLSLGTTKVAFSVRPRTQGDRPSRGAIFAVEGGPGYASSWDNRTYTKLFGSLLRRRELVMVDMRGTGNSHPLDCPDLQLGRAPDWIAMSQCARKLGRRFGSYRTSAAADDINDVRRALGFDHITLYGDSYGTYLSQSYAFRHPDTLNALVLDSAYPVSGESAWYPSIIATGVRGLSTACRRSPSCTGDAGKRLDKLVRWLRTRHRGVGPLVDALSGAGYSPPDSYLRIDRAGTQLRHGNALRWKAMIAEAKLGHGHVHHYSAMDEEVVSCNDYPLLWDKNASEKRRRIELQRNVRKYQNPALHPFSPTDVALSSETLYQYCLTAPRPSPLYEPPVSPRERPTKAPVLVISGELDNVTTPYEGKKVAQEFPNARRFIARGAGHVADLYEPVSSPAAVHLRRFLRQVLPEGR